MNRLFGSETTVAQLDAEVRRERHHQMRVRLGLTVTRPWEALNLRYGGRSSRLARYRLELARLSPHDSRVQ